jgi:uncharacterized RDD family membrane protein YckC
MNERIPELNVEATTGVDVALRIVGAGGRSYAFIIDWHIRLLLALAWWLVSTVIYFGQFVFDLFTPESASKFLFVTLPTLAIYFLYHPILEVAMRGRTPGKRMAGIRIVTRDGAAPGVGALLIRNAFRLVDSLPVFYCLGLGFVLSTAQYVRIGDLAAGTLLVYEAAPAAFPRTRVAGARDPRVDELVDELVARWGELAPEARTRIGRRLLERIDPNAGALDESALFDRLRSFGAAQPATRA